MKKIKNLLLNKKLIKKNTFQIILITLLTIFGFLVFSEANAAWINNTNDTQTKKVINAFSNNHDVISIIGKRVGVSNPRSKEHSSSINEYLQIVAYFESKLNKNAKNPNSSASSYFQFLNSSFRSTLKIIRKGHYSKPLDSTFPNGSSIFEYSYQGQSQLAITLWYYAAKWRKNEKVLKGLYNRDYNTALKVYCSYHHTDCSRQLSSSRYRALKGAFYNWSINKYNIGPSTTLPKLSSKKESIVASTPAVTNNASENIKKSIDLNLKNKTDDEKISILKELLNDIKIKLDALIEKKIKEAKEKQEKTTTSNHTSDIKTPTKVAVDVPDSVKNFCPDLIDNSISRKGPNKRYDVYDLENFLNRYENENLIVNGTFEKVDVEAVKRFQLKYKKDILDPIGETKAPGDVYKMTREKINNLYCGYKKSGNPIPRY